MADIEIRDNGAKVTASPDDRIVIRLPENATTGYQWVPEEIPDPLELESSELTPPGGSAPGAAGERTVVLRARHDGRARVALRLQRAWDSDDVLDRFEAEVAVYQR